MCVGACVGICVQSRVRMYTGPAVMYFINLAAVLGFSIFFMLRSDVKLTLVALCPLPILAVTISITCNYIAESKGISQPKVILIHYNINFLNKA